MTSTLDPEYSKILSASALLVTLMSTFAWTHEPGCSLEGLCGDVTDSPQKHTDLDVREANRLKYIRNSCIAISRLPAELLSDVFLYVVETGLERGNTSFAAGTFVFLQVCKRRNEIAVWSPQFWVWLISGTLKAWDLFKSRSKDAPLFLTWRTWLPKSALNIPTESETPRRIR